MALGPFFHHMAEKHQNKFTHDGFTVECSEAETVVPAADIYVAENRVVFFKNRADRELLTLNINVLFNRFFVKV